MSSSYRRNNYYNIETGVKSPTTVQEAAASHDKQTLFNQHEMLKMRAKRFVAEAANLGSSRYQKHKKQAEDGFKQETDDFQQGASETTEEEDTEDPKPGKEWCEFSSFMQQAQKHFRQHAKGIQDLKECTEQLQKDTETVLMVANGNTETLNEVFDADGLEKVNPFIKEMHKDLHETKKVVELIKMEQKEMKTLVEELHAAKLQVRELAMDSDSKLPNVHMQPNSDPLMEMMKQVRQEMRENHERESAWFEELKNMQKQ